MIGTRRFAESVRDRLNIMQAPVDPPGPPDIDEPAGPVGPDPPGPPDVFATAELPREIPWLEIITLIVNSITDCFESRHEAMVRIRDCCSDGKDSFADDVRLLVAIRRTLRDMDADYRGSLRQLRDAIKAEAKEASDDELNNIYAEQIYLAV